MALERWSDKVTVARLGDDPLLTDDLVSLEHAITQAPVDVVLDFAGVQFINSSNLAKLLKLRKKIHSDENRLVLCNLGTHVWGALLVTGIEKLFTVSDNVTTALATLQME